MRDQKKVRRSEENEEPYIVVCGDKLIAAMDNSKDMENARLMAATSELYEAVKLAANTTENEELRATLLSAIGRA